MASLERQAFAKKVVHFYVNFSACDKFETANHLVKSGRPLATETILKTRKVVKLLENTNNSERDVAKKCGLTQTCVHNIKIRSGLKTKKCSTVSHHTEDQKRRAKTNCGRFANNHIKEF